MSPASVNSSVVGRGAERQSLPVSVPSSPSSSSHPRRFPPSTPPSEANEEPPRLPPLTVVLQTSARKRNGEAATSRGGARSPGKSGSTRSPVSGSTTSPPPLTRLSPPPSSRQLLPRLSPPQSPTRGQAHGSTRAPPAAPPAAAVKRTRASERSPGSSPSPQSHRPTKKGGGASMGNRCVCCRSAPGATQPYDDEDENRISQGLAPREKPPAAHNRPPSSSASSFSSMRPQPLVASSGGGGGGGGNRQPSAGNGSAGNGSSRNGSRQVGSVSMSSSSSASGAHGDDEDDEDEAARARRAAEKSKRVAARSRDEEAAAAAADDEEQEPAQRPAYRSRRRLSLTHADPIRHEEVKEGFGLVISARGASNAGGVPGSVESFDKRPGFKDIMSRRLKSDGTGWCLSIAGTAPGRHQANFETKTESLRGNVPQDESRAGDWAIGHACRKGLKPESPNQDDFFILNLEDYGLYGVFDGHGPFGHDVSNFVQTRVAEYLWDHPAFETDVKEALRQVFKRIQDEVKRANDNRRFNATMSGCTATVVVHDLRENKLISAHLGDSRAVLAKRMKNGGYKAFDVTEDHKPTLPKERQRIEAMGGVVQRLENDIPFRVFLKNQMCPGLAMSRAFGDLVGAEAGVIAEPDINEYDLDPAVDAFLLVCSDGVWEFISSQEAVDMVGKFNQRNAQQAADHLAKESWSRWIDEEDDVVDDITVEVIHLFPTVGRRASMNLGNDSQ